MSLIAKQVAKKAAKSMGKKANDLGTPASVAKPESGKALRTQGPGANEGSVRSSQVASKRADDFDKDMKKTTENIKDYQEKLTKLKSSLKAFGGKNPPLERRIESTQTLLTQAKQKLADKKSRGGPGGNSNLTTGQRKQIKKAGGKVIKKMAGGTLKDMPAGNKGLPNLPTATRNKMGYKKAGGMVKKMGGGKIYNRGKGGRVIKSSNSGQDLVNSCYD